MVTKKQLQTIQDGVETEGFDYYFIEYTDRKDIKDAGFRLRLRAFREAREELIRYLGLEV